MKRLTKYDVLVYLDYSEDFKHLFSLIKKNILYRSVTKRVVYERLLELRKDGFVDKLKIKKGAVNSVDCLAMLYWMKLKQIDYNKLLAKNVIKAFKILCNFYEIELQDLIRESKLSRSTVLNAVDVLEKNNFIKKVKRKPAIIRVNLNDAVLFYINFLNCSLGSFQKQFKTPEYPEMHSKRLIEELTKLHVYSTTVTEGNTATEKDVGDVLNNKPVELTPREITEILNSRKSIDYLYSVYKQKISLFEIKKFHSILMNSLVESTGEFYYGSKKVIGSETKFPSSKQEIDYSLSALANFCEKYGKLKPTILAAIVHFIFVTIHPFVDGNGRIARLLHSWILLKSNLPLFVFDPNRKNKYFDSIEKGRNENIEEFVAFCLNEQCNMLKKLR